MTAPRHKTLQCLVIALTALAAAGTASAARLVLEESRTEYRENGILIENQEAFRPNPQMLAPLRQARKLDPDQSQVGTATSTTAAPDDKQLDAISTATATATNVFTILPDEPGEIFGTGLCIPGIFARAVATATEGSVADAEAGNGGAPVNAVANASFPSTASATVEAAAFRVLVNGEPVYEVAPQLIGPNDSDSEEMSFRFPAVIGDQLTLEVASVSAAAAAFPDAAAAAAAHQALLLIDGSLDIGACGQPTIPTLNRWGLLLLIGVIGLVGFLGFRRRFSISG